MSGLRCATSHALAGVSGSSLIDLTRIARAHCAHTTDRLWAPVRVLILSPETPAHPGTGGQTRQHCLLEPLLARHQIRVLSTGGSPLFGAAPEGLDVRYVTPRPPRPAPPGSWLRRNIDHVLHGPPWVHYFGLYDCDALEPELTHHLDDFQPDLVQVEHGHLAPLLLKLPPGMPRTLALHNLLVRNHREILGPLRTPRSPVGTLMETLVTARQERKDMLSATAVIVVSERDARLARRLQPHARVRVVPNSIPVAYWERTSPPAEKPTIVMSATYFWPPNQFAARTLVTEVFPEVRRHVPDAELLLVGQGVPSWLEALVEASEGVGATGQVDDVRPYLHQAWIAVAPLRRAGGSQVKVMEALASGVPAVTTRAVAAALDVGEADGVVAVDDHRSMAEMIARLLRDPAQRALLSERGATAARRRFDREPAARLQEQVWLEAISTGSQRAHEAAI